MNPSRLNPFFIYLIFFVNISFALIPDKDILCPNPEPKNGRWLYHEESQACFLSHGFNNPCGQLMRFYQSSSDPRIGICECDDAEYSKLGCALIRPKLYYPQHRRCYPAFDQGPCHDGEWLTLLQGRSICQPRDCPPNSNLNHPHEFWFKDQWGHCRRSYSLGLCQNFTILVYKENSFRPECSDRYLHYGFYHLVRDRIDGILRQNQNHRNDDDYRDIFLGFDRDLSCSRPDELDVDKNSYISRVNECKPGGKLFVSGKCSGRKNRRYKKRRVPIK